MFLTVLAGALLAAPAVAAVRDTMPAPVVYRIDPAHSRVTFKIRHFVSKVDGRFDRFAGTITMEPGQPATGVVDVAIETASINTNNASRDNHLRSGDFFLADSFPQIRFVSTKVEAKGTALTIHGTLTIRGVSKPVVLTGEYLGKEGTEPKERLGFEATTKIDRLDYGVKWNRAAEAGAMLGDEVTIELGVEAIRAPATPPGGK